MSTDPPTTDLLSTKLMPPQREASFVRREGLMARLDAGLERKCTLINAPAGFGKTALVSEWLSRRSFKSVAWLALDDSDNDPIRFWRYVLTACQRFAPLLGRNEIARLRSAQQVSFESLLTTFINALSELEGKHILVLENYHSATLNQIHQTVAFLLEHLPATLHIVILTRGEPSLPLGRLRARNELNELNAGDLRFSDAETREFLQNAVPVPLSPFAIAQLVAHTEGWPAGLRLATLALQGRHDAREIEGFVASFTGSHRHVVDYLITDVLSAQPEDTQLFLLQTSFLSRLTGSLCNAVTGGNDGAIVLERLERQNVFVTPLGAGGAGMRWYRYHSLFAEAMHHYARQRLSLPDLHACYLKASEWYAQHNHMEEAIETSLLGQDYPRAAALLEQYLEDGNLNEAFNLRRWIEQLPAEICHASPALCFAMAMAILFTSDRYAPSTRTQVEVWLQLSERNWRVQGQLGRVGEVLALRAAMALWQNDAASSFSIARQALELLPDDETLWRGSATLQMSLEALFNGDALSAQRYAIEAHALGAASGNIFVAHAAYLILAQTCFAVGELHQAESIYQVVAQEATPANQDDHASALIGLAEISYEWNHIDEAAQYATSAAEIGARLGDAHLQSAATLLAARVQWARGEKTQARQLLRPLLAQPLTPGELRQAQALQARFALSQGELASVHRWQMSLVSAGELPYLQREAEALLVARLHILQGEPDAALGELASWERQAHEHERTRSEAEINLLKALAEAGRNPPQAKQWLGEALRLAQPEGFQRLFLDEGETLALLLRTTLLDLRDANLAAYAQGLLHALIPGAPEASSAEGMAVLIEPLSAHEQRVLRLLAAGMSNPDIARELVVSVNTVKTQLQSIYRKLNVNSRAEARAAARLLNLL